MFAFGGGNSFSLHLQTPFHLLHLALGLRKLPYRGNLWPLASDGAHPVGSLAGAGSGEGQWLGASPWDPEWLPWEARVLQLQSEPLSRHHLQHDFLLAGVRYLSPLPCSFRSTPNTHTHTLTHTESPAPGHCAFPWSFTYTFMFMISLSHLSLPCK